jgi:GGDEF domain-containing protein
MRLTIEPQPLVMHVGPLTAAMSLGIAGTDDWAGLSAEPLIHEADLALYRAKELRRNSCVLARPTGLEESFTNRAKTPISAA